MKQKYQTLLEQGKSANKLGKKTRHNKRPVAMCSEKSHPGLDLGLLLSHEMLGQEAGLRQNKFRMTLRMLRKFSPSCRAMP